jgi:WS/DGAT/MGAT family acyltransferase
MDAAFLYLETPSAHMHVTGTMVLDPSGTSGVSPGRIERIAARRLANIPRLRCRVVHVPLGLEHPVWVEDPDFRIHQHVHRRTLRKPGSERELTALVAEIAGRPLRRDRPLWELWGIRGLAGGRTALVVKVHHSAMDGVSGSEVMAQILDLQPCETSIPRRAAATVRTLPSTATLLRSAIGSLAARPVQIARVLRNTGRFALRALTDARPNAAPTLPFQAPRTTFNRAISPDRAVAFGRVPLADVKRVKDELGMTVNDVVLAACTMALRQYLAAHGEVPDRPLVACVPVAGKSGYDVTNDVSAMFVGLPVQIDDPLTQLRNVAEDCVRAKRLHRALGPSLIQEWAQLLPPGLSREGSRLFWRLRLAELIRPVHNLVVSNVPGPQVPLYAAGARVVEVYPLGPVLDGAGCNVTVLSYDGAVHFGIITCRRAVPDPTPIARSFEQAVAGLVEVVAAAQLAARAQSSRGFIRQATAVNVTTNIVTSTSVGSATSINPAPRDMTPRSAI